MPESFALALTELPVQSKKTVTLGDVKILLVRDDDREGAPSLFALEAECPHAKGPLEQGAVCNGRLVCPWHTGTFALDTGKLLEPPPLRDLKRYAVRLEGDRIFVDTEPVTTLKPAPVGHGKHLVFAGAGAATAAALAFLRDAGFAGRITVIDPDAEEPVDRTQLSKMALAGKKPLDTLALFPAAEISSVPLTRVRDEVASISPDERMLTLSTGSTLRFDALLLATGGKPRLPALPAVDIRNLFTVRHPHDLRRMESQLEPGKRAVLLGDSFIAFEAASALRERGLEVTVIARSAQPFAGKFGVEVAQALLDLHRKNGVVVHTHSEAASVEAGLVMLKSGQRVQADVIVAAIGVDPIVRYAPALPKGERGGFATDRTLRVAPHVWVAGDIASVGGTRIEHWRLAQQHGRVAAAAMLADVTDALLSNEQAEPFAGVPFFWTFHFGKRFNYAGHADKWDRIEFIGSVDDLNFVALYITGETIAAALGCGRDTAIASLMEPLRTGALSPAEAQRLVAEA